MSSAQSFSRLSKKGKGAMFAFLRRVGKVTSMQIFTRKGAFSGKSARAYDLHGKISPPTPKGKEKRGSLLAEIEKGGNENPTNVLTLPGKGKRSVAPQFFGKMVSHE